MLAALRITLRVLAALFFLLAISAIVEAVSGLLAWRSARAAGQEVNEAQFANLVLQLGLTWAFAGIYLVLGWNLWHRRRFGLVVALLILLLVALWMGVGFVNGFVLAFVALAVLALPRVRPMFTPPPRLPAAHPGT